MTIRARQGELPQVRLDENGLIIPPLKAATPPATEIARRAVYDRLPRVKITDLLLEVPSGYDARGNVRNNSRRQRSRRLATCLSEAIRSDSEIIGRGLGYAKRDR